MVRISRERKRERRGRGGDGERWRQKKKEQRQSRHFTNEKTKDGGEKANTMKKKNERSKVKTKMLTKKKREKVKKGSEAEKQEVCGELKSLRSIIVAAIEQSKTAVIEAGQPRHLDGIKGCVPWPFTQAGKDRPLVCSSQTRNVRENITAILKIKVGKKTESVSRCFVF